MYENTYGGTDLVTLPKESQLGIKFKDQTVEQLRAEIEEMLDQPTTTGKQVACGPPKVAKKRLREREKSFARKINLV